MNDKSERHVEGESVNDKDNGNAFEKENDNTQDVNAHKDRLKFDWVTARSSCSLPKVFATLRQQVAEDVTTRNALRPSFVSYEFSVADDTDEFSVFLKAKDVKRSVTFKLAEQAISVRDEMGSPMFQVTLTFDDNGKCKLHANEKECEFWQLRRMALEGLMFA